jgi:hypothetical protein
VAVVIVADIVGFVVGLIVTRLVAFAPLVGFFAFASPSW